MSKTALITGGSQGLGFALGKNLALKGYTASLLARTRSKLEAAVERIVEAGGKARMFPVDISDHEAMAALAEKIRERFGTIDFLVNNAGVFHAKTLESFSAEEIREDIDVSLFGSILCTRLFLPAMAKGGKILFVSSGFGLMGPAGYAPYAAAKAGLINLAEALQRDVGNKGIRVYVSVPSDIDTPGFEKEKASLPPWMKISDARGKPIPPEIAAETILRKCKGKRFFIFSDPGVLFLYFLYKLAPRRLRNLMIDSVYPRL